MDLADSILATLGACVSGSVAAGGDVDGGTVLSGHVVERILNNVQLEVGGALVRAWRDTGMVGVWSLAISVASSWLSVPGDGAVGWSTTTLFAEGLWVGYGELGAVITVVKVCCLDWADLKVEFIFAIDGGQKAGHGSEEGGTHVDNDLG